jgi:hypothetical protein
VIPSDGHNVEVIYGVVLAVLLRFTNSDYLPLVSLIDRDSVPCTDLYVSVN